MAEWTWLGPQPPLVAEGRPYVVNVLVRDTSPDNRVRIIERSNGQPDRMLSVFLTGAAGGARGDCLVLAKRLNWRDRWLRLPIGERQREYQYDGNGVYPLITSPQDSLRVRVVVPTRRRLAAVAAVATSLAPVAKLAVDPNPFHAIEAMAEMAAPLHDRLERAAEGGPPPEAAFLDRARRTMERHLEGSLGSALLVIAEAAGQLQVMRDIERQAPGGFLPDAAVRFAVAKMTTAERLLDVIEEIAEDVSRLPRDRATEAAGILMQVAGLSRMAEEELVRLGDQGGIASNLDQLREQLRGDITAASRVTQHQGELSDEDIVPDASDQAA